MSKMTQRRMNRRVSRKLARQGRELRRKHVEVNALSANLQQAFNALRAQRDTIRALKGQPVASPVPA